MDSKAFSSVTEKIKVPDILDFTKYLKEQKIYHRRLSAYANIVSNPDLVHMNLALAKRQKYIVRDTPLKILNGSTLEATILCSKYAKNFGVLCDVSLLQSRTREIEHNLQLEMSINGPIVRYTFIMTTDLKNDLINDLSAQFIASSSCGLVSSSKISQPFAIGAHLWGPFPFVELLRTHVFLGYGASPNQPSYTAGAGITTQFGDRGRIDLSYCIKSGIQLGIGFDY